MNGGFSHELEEIALIAVHAKPHGQAMHDSAHHYELSGFSQASEVRSRPLDVIRWNGKDLSSETMIKQYQLMLERSGAVSGDERGSIAKAFLSQISMAKLQMQEEQHAIRAAVKAKNDHAAKHGFRSLQGMAIFLMTRVMSSHIISPANAALIASARQGFKAAESGLAARRLHQNRLQSARKLSTLQSVEDRLKSDLREHDAPKLHEEPIAHAVIARLRSIDLAHNSTLSSLHSSEHGESDEKIDSGFVIV